MNPKFELLNMSDFKLNLTGASGSKIPYSGYFEAEICMSKVDHEPVTAPVLVVPTIRYSGQAPLIVVQILLTVSRAVSETIQIYLMHGIMHFLLYRALKLR